MEVAKEALNLSDGEIQTMLHDMYQDVSETLKEHGIDYADLKSALTPSSDKHEIAFVFDSSLAISPFYGEEFAHVWLGAIQIINGPMRTAILEGDIYEPQMDVVQLAIDEQLKLRDTKDKTFLETDRYFVVYFTNVSNDQREELDREMRTRSKAYLGFLGWSGRNSFKSFLRLPQVALRIDDSIITDQDEDGTANMRGYPFEEFGFKIVGVDELTYGTFLEFKIDNSISHLSNRDSEASIGALSGFMRDVSSMTLIISKGRSITANMIVQQILAMVDDGSFDDIEPTEQLFKRIENYKRVTSQLIKDHGIESNERAHFKNYASYILRQGTLSEQDGFIRGLNIPMFVEGKQIFRRI